MTNLDEILSMPKVETKSAAPTVTSGKPASTPTRPVPGTPIERVSEAPVDPFNAAFDDLLKKTLAQNDPISKPFIEFMEKYVADLAPGVDVDKIKGATYQQNFFKALKTVIDKSTSENFRKNWIVVLSYFWRYRDGAALGERYVNRFSEYWPANDPNITPFQRIVNLCMVSANPTTRDQVPSRVDIVRTMEEGFSVAGDANIKAFYKV